MSLTTIFLLSFILPLLHPSHSLTPSDTQALFDIRASLRGLPGSTFFSTWDFTAAGADPCASFSGIVCSLDRVSVLTLGTGLEGSPGLAGTLPPSIANLTALTELVVYPGRVSGPIPSQIGEQCRRLKLVSLCNNLISGTIPVSFAGLRELHTLDLGGNQLTGAIPPALFSLPALRIIVMASNKLSGSLPSSISSTSILHLDLRQNSLVGLLPTLPASLRYLSVAGNSLSASIDGAFSSNMFNLTYIDLSSNQLTGKIPSSIFLLPQLSSISLQRNSFSGPLTLPESPAKSWQVVDLSHNVITGEVPSALATAENLFLNSNKFVGPVPRPLVDSVYSGNTTTFYAQHNFLTAFPAAPLPETVSVCLAFNCMDLAPAAEAGCPVPAEAQRARPKEQCTGSQG